MRCLSLLFNIFQFHKGTIRTEYGPTTYRPHYQFQFHKGTIRTKTLGVDFDLLQLFQFHKGTIRTL